MSTTTKILNAATITSLTSETSTTKLEEAIDVTISALNIYRCDIPLLSGTAGTKSVTLTSQQYGAVMMVLRTIFVNYAKNFSGTQSIALGQISMTYAESLSNPGNMQIIKEIAWQLRSRGILRTFG
jgi:hypothetical protein